MTIQECYEKLGGNFDDVMARMMKEERVAKFAVMFLDDPSYGQLSEAMDAGDVEAAFKAAHTLKGVCANLSLSRLQKSAIDVTEALRDKNFEGASGLMPTLKADYELTIETIQEFKG